MVTERDAVAGIAGARIDDVVVALAVEDEEALVVAGRREGVVDEQHLAKTSPRAPRGSRMPTTHGVAVLAARAHEIAARLHDGVGEAGALEDATARSTA